MTKQKVITVNINLGSFPDEKSDVNEIELTTLNKYLEEGYIVADRFSTVSNATGLYVVNLTFVLQKDSGK
jgi:hypothetical protein